MNLGYTPEFFKEAEAYITEKFGYAGPAFSYTAQEPGSDRCPMMLICQNDTVEGEGVKAEQDGKNVNISIGSNYKDVAVLDGFVVTMHIDTYAGTQFNIITQGEMDGVIKLEEFLDGIMGTMDWLHVYDIHKTLPCINGYWIDLTPLTSDRDRKSVV